MHLDKFWSIFMYSGMLMAKEKITYLVEINMKCIENSAKSQL